VSLKWPLAYVLFILPVSYIVFRLLKKRRTKRVFVAEALSLKHLPSYKKIHKKSTFLHTAQTVVLVLLLFCLATLAARPMQSVTSYNEEKSRDIVLVLDVSRSMEKFVAPALDAMQQIIKENPSDRYSIVVFAARSYVVLPITRDPVAINEKITMLRDIYTNPGIHDKNYTFRALIGSGTDIGEGVLAATNRFTNLTTYKSRSVILLSDLVQTGGDYDPDSQFFLNKVGLLPKYQINFYVMKVMGPDARYANDEIVDIGGGTAFEVASEENSGAIKSVVSDIFKQALNTSIVATKNTADAPQLLLVSTGIVLVLWVLLFALQTRKKA
jgi:von Willebrand factor type A domain